MRLLNCIRKWGKNETLNCNGTVRFAEKQDEWNAKAAIRKIK